MTRTIKHPFEQTNLPSRKEKYQQRRQTVRKTRVLQGMLYLLTSLILATFLIPSQQEVHSNAKQDVIKAQQVYPFAVNHKVKPGETLFSITRKYYPSAAYLNLVSEYNGITNPTTDLKAGMNLYLPEPYILAFHTVQEGETIYSIAKEYYSRQFFINYLSAINNVKDPATDVKIGKVLEIPSSVEGVTHSVESGETIYSIMMVHYNLNKYIDKMMKINSIQDPSKDVHAGLTLSIGNPFFKEGNISIHAKEENISIVINKGKNTLQVFDNGKIIKSFSVGTGRTLDLTPVGEFSIINMLENPWFSPKEISGGDPNNPLGTRWMGLDVPNTKGTKFGIHGTNEPQSIGGYVSSGCIRMNNVDVEWLYNKVSIGTKVRIKEK